MFDFMDEYYYTGKDTVLQKHILFITAGFGTPFYWYLWEYERYKVNKR